MKWLIVVLIVVDIIIRIATYNPCTTYEPVVKVYKDGGKITHHKPVDVRRMR